MSSNLCEHILSSKNRYCKNYKFKDNLCKTHYDSTNGLNLDKTHHKNDFEYGICCFCENQCNPHSQSCGKCARDITMIMMVWK